VRPRPGSGVGQGEAAQNVHFLARLTTDDPRASLGVCLGSADWVIQQALDTGDLRGARLSLVRFCSIAGRQHYAGSVWLFANSHKGIRLVGTRRGNCSRPWIVALRPRYAHRIGWSLLRYAANDQNPLQVFFFFDAARRAELLEVFVFSALSYVDCSGIGWLRPAIGHQ